MHWFLVFALALSICSATQSCQKNWGKCGGKGWNGPTTCCNTRYFCNDTGPYYSECVPKPLVPYPPAPPSKTCGHKGIKANSTLGATVSPLDIALIWSAATRGLTDGHAPGGYSTCVEAVTISLGECGHPAQSPWKTIHDPVCSKAASGAGGLWQVTSASKDDRILAGCTDTFDYCCNARFAYAHAYNFGGATIVPENYCDMGGSCKQYHTPWGVVWNSPTVDKANKPGQKIPNCNVSVNPWYSHSGAKKLPSISADQEPCWYGPFSVAGGGVGKSFFPGFYGWGGFFEHYAESKAGECDYSPQGSKIPACAKSGGKLAELPTFTELAAKACAAINPNNL